MNISRLLKKKHKKKLVIDLLPKPVQNKTLFQRLSRKRSLEEWTKIKQELLRREGSRCYICGKETKHLHMHEFWHFDDATQTMRLEGIHHLCDLCQKVKRTDFWFFTPYGKEQLKHLDINTQDIIKHYCKVNNCSIEEFNRNWRQAVETWQKRNEKEWKLDFGEYMRNKIDD